MAEAPFPERRLRRLRRGRVLRDAVADVTLSPGDLICPLFVGELAEPMEVPSMPGVHQWPVEQALEQIAQLADMGLRQFILFGITPEQKKDPAGRFAADAQAPVNRVLAGVREAQLDVVLYADLCLCEYTDHGHCGILSDDPAGTLDNDRTLEALGETAVVQARAGADVVAPSGMMDGQVGAIRGALDQAGQQHVAILSYAVKFASSFYGPFREAGGGGMRFGDRKGYQMDYRRSREWASEVQADVAEGADMVMVKPAMSYLDIVRQVRELCALPVVAYHVSGEYAMLHAGAQRGWLDLKEAALESSYAMRRAGADLIVSYFAADLARWLSAE